MNADLMSTLVENKYIPTKLKIFLQGRTLIVFKKKIMIIFF